MRVLPTELPGLVVIEPDVHRDGRGFVLETYHAGKYLKYGLLGPFVQDTQSHSVRNTVRGLHLQVSRPQAKLVRVIAGEIFDVAVDVRRGSPTFGRWVGLTLTADSFRQCFVPAGFAHGFSVTSEIADVEYKCTALYDPASEIGIAWNDPDLAVRWPVERPILSERDRRHPSFAAVADLLPVYERTNL